MKSPRCTAILVVEDQKHARKLVVDVLRGDGFHVFAAESAEEAIEVLRDMPEPALVLADLLMPFMDGRAFVRSLRESDRFATLPVVMVAEPDASDPGAYWRMKQPVAAEDLLRIVEELCVRRT